MGGKKSGVGDQMVVAQDKTRQENRSPWHCVSRSAVKLWCSSTLASWWREVIWLTSLISNLCWYPNTNRPTLYGILPSIRQLKKEACILNEKGKCCLALLLTFLREHYQKNRGKISVIFQLASMLWWPWHAVLLNDWMVCFSNWWSVLPATVFKINMGIPSNISHPSPQNFD